LRCGAIKWLLCSLLWIVCASLFVF
jgi:hypothetical protein